MPEHYRRNSLRYPGYDYSQAGAYFLTINTHLNQHLFGSVTEGQLDLSVPGQAVHDAWTSLDGRFPGSMLDAFIVMPNHVHGIVMLGADPNTPIGRYTAGDMVNSFKNTVLAAWRKGVREAGWPRYSGHLWHRDYYERIIRNDSELDALREYILANPDRWAEKRGG